MGRQIKNICGEKFKTTEGYTATVINHYSSRNIVIEFNDESKTIIEKVDISQLRKGNVKNPNHRSIYKIGYYGQGVYKCRINNKNTKYYAIWRNMFTRCYDPIVTERNKSYVDSTIIEEWHSFQNFAKWYEENWKPYMEGWHLDKDILIKGNKVYSPETCCFVPPEINNLFTSRKKIKPNCQTGVRKRCNMFEARTTKNGNQIHLGYFDTCEEAFQAYKIAKEARIKEIASKWRGKITEKCYHAMYTYKVEITD